MGPERTEESALRFNLLGEFEIRYAGTVVDPGTAGAQSLLVALLLRPEGYPDAAELIRAIWGEPATQRDTLYKYGSQARRVIEPYGLTVGRSSRMRYRLAVPDSTVDARRFTRLVATADALASSEPEESARRRRAALALWRGPLACPHLRLAGIRRLVHELETMRLDTEELVVTAELNTGAEPGRFLGHLQDLYASHPAHVGIAATLIRALHAGGYDTEGSELFHRVSSRYAGIPPKLQQAQRYRPPEPARPARAPAAAGPAWPVPNDLPPDTRHFVGRDRELAELTRERDRAAGPAIVAVSGMPGVGKTALVVRAAGQLARQQRYPDGTLYVDLAPPATGGRLDPADALEILLRRVGVPAANIPPDVAARASHYRTVLAPRRMLIVLDNARDEAQVRPLLPSTASSLVLLTSRHSLAGLDDADHIRLDVLPLRESADLLRSAVAPRDPGSEQTIERVVRLCGRLPLAIRIVGARMRTTRALTVERLLEQLETERSRLHVLEDGERSVAAAISTSMSDLTDEQRRAFALFGIHPGVEYEPYAAAALLGVTPSQAQHLLDALERASLLDQPTLGRFTFHDLVRAYAANLAAGLPDRGALVALYDFYARTAAAAMDALYPFESYCRPRYPWGPDVEHRVQSPHLPDVRGGAAARAWLTVESDNLLASAHDAADRGEPRHAIFLSATLHRHLRMLGRYADALALHARALTLARQIGDIAGELDALITYGYVLRFANQYGPADACLTEALATSRHETSAFHELRAATGLGQIRYAESAHDEASRWFGVALDLANERGDQIGAVDALNGLARVRYLQGRYPEAAQASDEALAISRREGYDSGELEALIPQALVTSKLGDHALAVRKLEQVRALARALGHQVAEINATIGLGITARLQKRYADAVAYFEHVLSMSRSIGDRTGELSSLSGLANSWRLRGRCDRAEVYFGQMVDTLRSVGGNRNYELEVHLGMGRTLLARDEPAAALDAFRKAETLAAESGQESDRIIALYGLGCAGAALGDLGAALDAWRAAVRSMESLSMSAADDIGIEQVKELIDRHEVRDGE